MKSVNPIQKYSHIIKSYACILIIFVIIILFPMNFLTSFGICSTKKLSRYVTSPAFAYNEFLLIHNHQGVLSNEFQCY